MKAVEVLRERERNGNIEGEELAETVTTKGILEALKLWETCREKIDVLYFKLRRQIINI